MLEFYNDLWELGPTRNTVFVPAFQATKAGVIISLELIPDLLKSLKIPTTWRWECYRVLCDNEASFLCVHISAAMKGDGCAAMKGDGWLSREMGGQVGRWVAK